MFTIITYIIYEGIFFIIIIIRTNASNIGSEIEIVLMDSLSTAYHLFASYLKP